MGKNRWTYQRPPAWKRNEPSFTETAVIRLNDLERWSNVSMQEIFRLSGMNITEQDQLPFIDRLGYETIIKVKNREIEHLQNFGNQLFENKLPNWRPPVYTNKHS